MSPEKIAFIASIAAAGLLAAAPGAPAFEKVPEPALAVLRIAKGRAITTGMVFVNGKLMKGPYVVSRYGTAIRVNRDQVTGQIVPWVQFTTAAGAKRHTPHPPPQANAAPPPPSPPTQASSVDDLFDDDPPSPTPSSASPATAAASAAPQPPPPPPPSAGEYADTPHSKALLKRINDYRTDIDRTLRDNGVFFFSARHMPVRVDSRLARDLMAVLPDALRDANDARQLYDMLRRRGITYIPAAACTELVRDRALYIKIRDRLREIREEQSFRELLGGSGAGL